jgi:protein-tyrosine-phosphatase
MKTILFVCTANIARSPMAEALFNQMMIERDLDDQYRAESAGTWSWGGAPAPEDGQKVMARRGLDTSTHRSREVTLEIMQNADLILTMEKSHVEVLKLEFWFKEDKIFLLSEMAGPAYDIDDPYRRGLERFEATARELEEILSDGIDKILELANENE